MEEFFTWSALATYSGATLATAFFTQILKGVGFIDKIPTRVTSFLIAFVVLFLATLFTGNLTAGNGVLCLVNAAVVSLASNGAYDAVTTVRGGPSKKV